ncbi:ATP-binding protein [Oceanobacillus halotolerans]|uniref:ATP-binding protein n=1 Tax=Oceanobacillus halotolerans TaxID=2663380 RepID=UPI0013D92EDD|nr:AAA family ATPase [Oceanobacillus halotolerans]
MKLLRATIYGFGKWVDESIDFSGAPFLCIHGENESGKSTLQQFILFMLYGLPPKKRAFYQPKTSSKMGGVLTIWSPSIGEVTIERFDHVRNGAAICKTSNGQTYDEEWLIKLLNGMTLETYQSIFSFSAVDLDVMKQMKGSDLSEVLFGIGLTGSATIHQLEKRLDQELSGLFKPYGKKPALNEQLKVVDNLWKTSLEQKQKESTYRSKKEQQHALETEMNHLESQLTENKKKEIDVDRHLQALPMLQAYQQTRSQLKQYPETIAFPENGIERLNQSKETMLPLKSELDLLQDKQQEYKAKQNELRSELYEKEVYEKVQQLVNQKQELIDYQAEQTQLGEQIQQLDHQIEIELQDMDIGIEREYLEHIQLPFHLERTWNELKEEQKQLVSEKEQLQQEETTILKQKQYLENQKEEKESNLLEEDELQENKERIQQYEKEQYIKYTEQQRTPQKENWQEWKRKRKKTMQYGSSGAFILSIPNMWLGITMENQFFYVVAGLLILVAAGIAIWSYQSMKLADTFLSEYQLNDVEKSAPSISKAEKNKAVTLLDTQQQALQDVQLIDDQLKKLTIQHMQLEERTNSFQVKQNRFQDKLEETYRDFPFLKRIAITYWPSFYHSLKQLINSNRQLQQIKNMVAKLENWQQDFHQEITQFYAENSWNTNSQNLEELIAELEHLLEEARYTKGLVTQYTKWIEENVHRQRELTKQISIIEREIEDLFQIANVTTEEAFYERAKVFQVKQQLVDKENELRLQLASWYADLDENALQAKANTDALLLERKKELIEQTISQVETTREATRQTLSEVKADLQKMEETEDYSTTIHRFSVEQESLNRMAKEWAIRKTAKEMLTKTKHTYRDHYLDKIVAQTSTFFEAITNGFYQRVFAPLETKTFRVETQDGIQYDVEELSQGTMNQLYVALRLAIGIIMSKKHHVPFMIDDAFVHFDDRRTINVIGLLENISEKHNHQIILFTCKEAINHNINLGKQIRIGNSVRII